MLETITPLAQNCGALCSAACCGADAEGKGGVYLFPAEEFFYENADWCDITQTDFSPMLTCKGACPRENRPLGCRVFPLTPVRREDGSLTVRMDARAREMCPLARSGVRGVNREFAKAVLNAMRLIDTDAEGKKFLEAWMALEEEFHGFTL